MTIQVHNVDTGYSFTHSGLTPREVNIYITQLSENKIPEHEIVITVKERFLSKLFNNAADLVK